MNFVDKIKKHVPIYSLCPYGEYDEFISPNCYFDRYYIKNAFEYYKNFSSVIDIINKTDLIISTPDIECLLSYDFNVGRVSVIRLTNNNYNGLIPRLLFSQEYTDNHIKLKYIMESFGKNLIDMTQEEIILYRLMIIENIQDIAYGD